MKLIQPFFAASLLAASIIPTLAAADTSNKDHHPTAEAKADQANTMPGMGGADVGTMQQRMMEMHEKMMAAKTPAERQALMADQMAAMHEGMAMMKQMGPGRTQHERRKGSMEGQEMMEDRLDRMESMMPKMGEDQTPCDGMQSGIRSGRMSWQEMTEDRLDRMELMMSQMGRGGMMARASKQGRMSEHVMQRQEMMESRMDVMQSMMQMMIDRIQSAPATK